MAHCDPVWLDSRLALFRRYYVPSVAGLGVPAALLCSRQSSAYVADAVRDLDWVDVRVQDDWHGGAIGESDQILTRFDSDDALRSDWFRAVEHALSDADAVITKRFLRLDQRKGKAYRYRRKAPSPLAAFRPGLNPYACDHEEIEEHHEAVELPDPFLLQVVHGGNLSNRFPKPFRRTASAGELSRFGLTT